MLVWGDFSLDLLNPNKYRMSQEFINTVLTLMLVLLWTVQELFVHDCRYNCVIDAVIPI